MIFSALVCSQDLDAGGEMSYRNEPFPKISFKDPVSHHAMSYLGLNRRQNFSLDNMKGFFFIIEFFNTYCTSCPRDVPILNDVMTAIEQDASLKGRVKVFGIAIGNTVREVENYHTQHHVLFPVITDSDFTVHGALGSPRVPYTMFVKRTARGNIVVESHQGVLGSAEHVLKVVQSFK